MPAADLPITASLTLPGDLLTERFVRAQGPGGQHVNKTSTAVELRFDLRASELPETVKTRLARLAGTRLNQEGVLVLFAQARASQQLNREEARDRLADLVRQALVKPKPRVKTRPTLASKERRLTGKRTRSDVKAGRGRPQRED